MIGEKHIEVRQLTKKFNDKIALDNVTLSFQEGSFNALIGPSGSGKSTFFRCLNKIILPTSGDIFIKGQNYKNMSRKEVCSQVSTIFQDFGLIPRLSVLSNVLMGRLAHLKGWNRILGIYSKQDEEKALRAIDKMRIISLVFHDVRKLSGGQQQRVAVARSMAQEANILLADEPIANLDPMNAELVLKTLKEISRENNITIIVNLHQIDMAIKYFDRIIGFGNGAVTYDSLYYGKFDMTHYEKIYK